MRILSNDFGGYPYTVQLARELARRGHDVLHTHCASLTTTPQGTLDRLPDDPASLTLRGLTLTRPLEKYAFVRRLFQEREYGRLVAQAARDFRPDVVLSANTPLDAQGLLLRQARRLDAGFVFWLQDIIGIAAEKILRDRVPVVGGPIGRHYVRAEARLLRASDHVVVITDDFRTVLRRWNVPAERTTTIENWAPIEQIPVSPKDNPWARKTGLDGAFVVLYSGTLALKHNPDLLLDLAVHVQGRLVDGRPVRVVVVSQGPGADYLRAQADARGLDTLAVYGYRPFGEVPDMLGAADVLAAVLEPDAGVYSVPSKVLTYLCAGRPILLSVPPDNLAARIVAREQAGLVVPPGDGAGFEAAADRLFADAGLRAAMGRNARAYAEATFPLGAIADRVEKVLADSCRPGASATRS